MIVGMKIRAFFNANFNLVRSFNNFIRCLRNTDKLMISSLIDIGNFAVISIGDLICLDFSKKTFVADHSSRLKWSLFEWILIV